MENVNDNILCDVTRCKHNANGKHCKLNAIKVTGDCSSCTCCSNFDSCLVCD